MNRFDDALQVQDAVNSGGVSLALTGAIKEARKEGLDTIATNHDPAVQLIVYKLAALAGFEPLSWRGYEEAKAACKLKSSWE